MAQWVLEQLSEIRNYSDSEELSDRLHMTDTDSASTVRLSPDGRHIHVILHQPQVGLVTFDKFEKPQSAYEQKRQSLRISRTVPIVDVLYLDHRASSSSGGAVVVAVVFESGKVEFWKFQECMSGWHLLQTSELCNSPRARVVSVCVCSNLILWCEERPPSESAPAPISPRNKLTYCVCRRDFKVLESTVGLGGVRIALHNNPKFTLISSGEFVHLLPDVKTTPLWNVSRFFLSWALRQDTFTVSTTCQNTPLKKLSAKESDFMKLVTDSLGYLSALKPPEITSFSPSPCGALLLLLSTGWLCVLHKDGLLRQVYKLRDDILLKHGTLISFCLYQDILALLMEHNLYLIDLNCGRELERTVVRRGGVLYPNLSEKQKPHFLCETGVFVLLRKETDFRNSNSELKASTLSTVDVLQPGALMVEAVFEEACKYYQQRSLSSTKLTVEALKKGGRFQAPISLASILGEFLSAGTKQTEAHVSQNGGGMVGQDKLMCSLETELKALVALEEVKGSLLRGSVDEVESMCECLVEKEVERLLFSHELDEEALRYLNSIFSLFPSQAWRAAQAALQLHANGKDCLSSTASSEVWKTVLSAPTSVSTAFTNGASKHTYSLKSDPITNCPNKCGLSAPTAPLPVFELLCQSIYHFQPSWLPQFLKLAQQQQGSAGLGLSLATSSWSFPGHKGGEVSEHSVPLYKRALCVLSSSTTNTESQQDLKVELLLVSGRPNAILHALRILISKQKWEQVTQVAHTFCKQSSLLNKEIFTILLCEVTQHRYLDPHLDLLWSLCPEDFTVTTILNLVLENLPSPSSSPHPPSFSLSSSSSAPAPFTDAHSSQLTIGLLKPLLRKVLQRETKPSQHYADILQSPSLPPQTLPPQPVESPGADSVVHDDTDPPSQKETPEHQTQTSLQRVRVEVPANPV